MVWGDQEKMDERRSDDFYPTPWDATEALMIAEEPWLRAFDDVEEPACGEGAMAEVIARHGKTVFASDLVDRGYGTLGDFLQTNRKKKAPALISNPPFTLAEDFIRQAYRMEYEYIALILKANYWNTIGRVPLFRECRPARIRQYSWRIDFTGGGSNHFDCMACIWMPGSTEPTEFCEPLQRPKFLAQPSLFEC